MFGLSCATRSASRRCCSLSRRPVTVSHGFSTLLPPFPTKRDDDADEHAKYHVIHPHAAHQYSRMYARNNNPISIREYHSTCSRERSAPALFLTFGAIAATAKAGQYAVQGYNEWKEASKLAAEEEQKIQKENKQNAESEDAHKDPHASGASNDSSTSGSSSGSSAGTDQKSSEKRENIFASFFNMSVGSKYYEGGFEDVMTRKEAALILGVRESSATKRIKEAHRKLLILNHPDTGGSTYMAGKINEAKELLLKGKKH